MKEYKLESLIFYSKISFNKDHLLESSSEEIQAKLDEYAKQGYKLVSTDATNFGAAVYFYLYFERDVK